MATTKPGDLWIAGPHRIICGDCADHTALQRLMQGELADLCVTSPPYAHQRNYLADIGDWDALMQGAFAGLPMQEAGQLLVNLGPVHKDGEVVHYWYDWVNWMRSTGWKFSDQYVWDKLAGLPGAWAGRLAPCHEYILHLRRQQRSVNKTVPKRPESVKALCRPVGLRGGDGKPQRRRLNPETSLATHKVADSVFRIRRFNGRSPHPAVYPVALPAALMAVFSARLWPFHAA